MTKAGGRGLSAAHCEGCAQAWLIPGACADETSIFKACGHALSVAEPRAGLASPRKRDARRDPLRANTGGGS